MSTAEPSSAAHRLSLVIGLFLLLGAAGLLLLGAGVGSTGFDSVLRARLDPVAWQIIWDIRLPRTLGAWVAGGLLGLAGAVAQGLFRNPLADPYLLGSASGAALGVAMALALFGASPFATSFLVRLGLTGAAFAGAVGGVMLTLALANGVLHTLRLLLAGVIVGVVLGAARDLVSLAAPDILQAMSAGLPAPSCWSLCCLPWALPGPWAGRSMAWHWARQLRPAWACRW